MALIIIALLLILGIAFFQVIQGVFSALIMTILTILCAAAAFTYYEPLAQLLYTNQPGYADAASLIAVFVIPLLILRILFDRFIRDNVVLGMWVDRIGGGVLGLVTGMIMVGVLAIAVQMLPFHASVLTFKPFDDSLRRRSNLAPFYPDRFTLALMETLSNGSLSGDRRLDKAHDDLLLEAFCVRNTAGCYGRVDATPDSLLGVEVFEAPDRTGAPWRDDVPDNPLLDTLAPTKDVIVRFKLDKSVRDEAPEDPDKDEEPGEYYRLPATHFRMVSATGRSYYPVAYLTYKRDEPRGRRWEAHAAEERNERTQIARLIVVRPFVDNKLTGTLSVDWVYRIPTEEKPRYVVFRRTAKKPVRDSIVVRMPPSDQALDREAKLRKALPHRRRRR